MLGNREVLRLRARRSRARKEHLDNLQQLKILGKDLKGTNHAVFHRGMVRLTRRIFALGEKIYQELIEQELGPRKRRKRDS
jgi:hypothetical protein